ncbi:MAG: AAA family ATPase [Ferruginibacter sp.]|nr:AAA family ATPase [Ferruginibacter sp.]
MGTKIPKNAIDLFSGVKIVREKSTLKSISVLCKEAKELGELKEVWGKFVGEGQVILFASPRGVGKSLLLMQLCISISYGSENFLGEKIGRFGNTLYINLEMGENIIKRRVHKIFANCPFEKQNNYEAHIRTTRHSLDEDVTEIIEFIMRVKPILIVIDNLRMSFLNFDFNSGANVSDFMKKIIYLRDITKSAIILVDHFKKYTSNSLIDEDSFSGSGVKLDLSDGAFFFLKSNQATNLRLLKRGKSREFEESDNVKLIEFNIETLWFSLKEESVNEADHLGLKKLSDKLELLDKAKELKEAGKTLDEIAAILGKGKTTIHRWLSN